MSAIEHTNERGLFGSSFASRRRREGWLLALPAILIVLALRMWKRRSPTGARVVAAAPDRIG